MRKKFEKKIWSKIIIICLALFITISAIVISWQGKVMLSPAIAENESNTEENSEISTTPFFINIGAAGINGDEILIYDDYDKMIKILNNELVFKQEIFSFETELSDVTDILTSDSFILLYDGNTKAFKAYNTTYNQLIFDTTDLTALTSAKQVNLVSINSNNYLLLSPEQNVNTFQLAKLSIDENNLVIESVINFSVNELYQQIANYDCIYLTQLNDNLLVMLISGTNVLSFEVSLDTDNQIINTTTTVPGIEATETVKYVKQIVLSGQELVAVATDIDISFYKLNTSPSLEFVKLDGDSIELNSQTVTDIATKNDKLILTFNEMQTAALYTITGTIDDYTISSILKSNPVVTVDYIDDSDFEYYKIDQATWLFDSPYSRAQIVEIPANKHVAIIATASSEGEQIVGWYYVLFSDNNSNHYGFIASSVASKLENDENYNNISVLDYTILHKYPSVLTDDKNNNLLVLNADSAIQVLDDLDGYTSLGSTYLHVKVNNVSGFIDIARVKENQSFITKIITDAVVTKDASEIFTEESSDSEIITYLNKGARVKIIGKRDTLTNLTHVVFNVENGEEIEGYIYTYNLKTDSWSMLQILGMLFVIINIILLMIIVIIKNKLAK